METRGKYKIENFRKLDEQIKRGNLEPHIYSGKVIDVPKLYAKGFDSYEITWDKFGRCSNWKREDCFIDVTEMSDSKN